MTSAILPRTLRLWSNRVGRTPPSVFTSASASQDHQGRLGEGSALWSFMFDRLEGGAGRCSASSDLARPPDRGAPGASLLAASRSRDATLGTQEAPSAAAPCSCGRIGSTWARHNRSRMRLGTRGGPVSVGHAGPARWWRHPRGGYSYEPSSPANSARLRSRWRGSHIW